MDATLVREDAEYEAVRIRGKRVLYIVGVDGKKEYQTQYLVGWKGYTRNKDTWEPMESLKNTTLLETEGWLRAPADEASQAERLPKRETQMCFGLPKPGGLLPGASADAKGAKVDKDMALIQMKVKRMRASPNVPDDFNLMVEADLAHLLAIVAATTPSMVYSIVTNNHTLIILRNSL
jgi:hypothetical protein